MNISSFHFFLPLLDIVSDLSYSSRKKVNPPPLSQRGKGRTLFQVNETNSVKYICIYIKFSMYKMNFIVTIKVSVYYLYFCHQYNNFKKLSKMFFIVPKRLLLPSRFFKLQYFSLPLFFPFLAIAIFTEEIDWDIIMSLNWILKTQIF